MIQSLVRKFYRPIALALVIGAALLPAYLFADVGESHTLNLDAATTNNLPKGEAQLNPIATATPAAATTIPSPTLEAIPTPTADSTPWSIPVAENAPCETSESDWHLSYLMSPDAYLISDERALLWPSVPRYRTMSQFGQTPELPDASNIRFGGWVEGGYTIDNNGSHNHSNYPVIFNYRSDDFLLNQLYVFAESYSQLNADWYWGNRVDLLYGTDAQFVRVPGLEKSPRDSGRFYPQRNDTDWALPQIYTEIGVPYADGLSLRVGHFYAPASFEGVPAPENFFYSHSYAFETSPFTYTGALFRFSPNASQTYYLGYTQGADVFFSDPAEWGILGGAVWRLPDYNTEIAGTIHVGDEEVWRQFGYRSWYRVFGNFQVCHRFDEQWFYLFEPFVGSLRQDLASSHGSDHYGINQAVYYQASNSLAWGTRFEWMRNSNDNFTEVTVGLNYRLRPNCVLRPELRWDYEDQFRDSNQVLLASDLIWEF